MTRFTDKQRTAVKKAGRDARELGMTERGWDVVDLACETDNFFWTGMNDRQARVACRYVMMAAQPVFAR